MTAVFPITFHLFETVRLRPGTHWEGPWCFDSEVRPLTQGSRDLTQERGLRSRSGQRSLQHSTGSRRSAVGDGVKVAGLTHSPPQKKAVKNAGILSHSLSLRNIRALLEAQWFIEVALLEYHCMLFRS